MYREDRQIREWHAAACAVRPHAPCQRSGATLRRITRAPLMRATHGQALGRSAFAARRGGWVMRDMAQIPDGPALGYEVRAPSLERGNHEILMIQKESNYA